MGCLTANVKGTVASFINPTVTDIESARVYFSPTQLGEGTPSPENVREIVGRTSVELYQCGKNLFPSADGAKSPLRLKKGTAITISQSADVNTGYFIGYDENNNAVGSLVWLNEGTVNGRKYRNYTLGADIYYAIIYVGTGMKDAQVTVDGSIDFKPYQGTTYSIDWTDDVGNIYGGYVDLVKGEIVEEWIKFTYDRNSTVATSGTFTLVEGLTWMTLRKTITSTPPYMSTPNGGDSYGFFTIGDWQKAAVGGRNRSFVNSARLDVVLVSINGEDLTTSEGRSEFFDYIEDNNIPIEVCYKLATPITHSLPDYLKTQLQTLKNENTFWSDADSVEIEYGLAETFDIQKAKRKIIMSQPHVETLTGDAVSFTTDMKAPLKECKVSFMPVQEGTGDPSPTNVRNITGWNGVNVNSGSNVYSVDWTNDVGTVYGGYVDLVKGELVQTYYGYTVDGVNIKANSAYQSESKDIFGAGIVYNTPRGKSANSYPYPTNIICNKLPVLASTSIYDIPFIYTSAAGTLYTVFFIGKISEHSEITTKADRIDFTNAWLQENPVQLIYELATPITYQLTPEQILSLKGINNFSCGIKNDMTVKYWKHKLSDSTNIAYEAENLTFDGTNYINTGVYLFSEKNIDKDFEVVIEDLYGNSGAGSITIVCAKYDSTSVGFLIRLNSSTSKTYNGTIFMKPNNHNNITIKRVNGVITIDGEVITNPTVKFTNTIHNHPLVLGCALQDDGTPMRYATGTIGHITVKWL